MAYKRQTDVVDTKTIRIGSVKLEIRLWSGVDGDYVDVGALDDASFVHSWTDVTVKSDNAGILEEGITDDLLTVSAIWKEINIENLAVAFAGIGTDATSTGVLVLSLIHI